jgi:ABC-type nickel/cobalt efflux system permease component RcnA
MQTAALPSLLDDAGFLAELEHFERMPKSAPDEAPISDAQLNAIEEVVPRQVLTFDEEARRRAHSALERALEPEYHAQQRHRHHSHDHQSHTHAHTPAPGRVPRAIVALVLMMGFLTGAGVAGVMFHDRLIQILAGLR